MIAFAIAAVILGTIMALTPNTPGDQIMGIVFALAGGAYLFFHSRKKA